MQGPSYFTALSQPALEFAIKDIGEALLVCGPISYETETKYADQLHHALAEKNRRAGKHLCPTCKRPL